LCQRRRATVSPTNRHFRWVILHELEDKGKLAARNPTPAVTNAKHPPLDARAHYTRQTTGVEKHTPFTLFLHDPPRRQTPSIQSPPLGNWQFRISVELAFKTATRVTKTSLQSRYHALASLTKADPYRSCIIPHRAKTAMEQLFSPLRSFIVAELHSCRVGLGNYETMQRSNDATIQPSNHPPTPSAPLSSRSRNPSPPPRRRSSPRPCRLCDTATCRNTCSAASPRRRRPQNRRSSRCGC